VTFFMNADAAATWASDGSDAAVAVDAVATTPERAIARTRINRLTLEPPRSSCRSRAAGI
jgi:hypothetical protein